MTDDIKKLCLDIVKADTQEDIKNILILAVFERVKVGLHELLMN